MAVCLATQKPDLVLHNIITCYFNIIHVEFITVTGHDSWNEIHRLRDGRETNNMIDLGNRVFKLKLDCLLKDIVKKQIFGKVVGRIWVIEYQKRG
jgi:hypothetical protein